MPYKIVAWRCKKLPVIARRRNQKARNYAGFRAFFANRCRFVPNVRSFPLDRRRRLARHVVGDARDAFDFVDDAVGDLFQQLVRQMRPASGHEIDGFHGTQRDDPGVTATVADHAD